MKYQTMIQLTSAEDGIIKSMTSQISNLMTALKKDVLIEIVCHGQSLDFVLNSGNKWTDTLQHLLKEQIIIVACENMLKAHSKSSDDLFPGIKTVPAAIAELVVKQQEGWSYIKAG